MSAKIPNAVNHFVFSSFRNILLGAGLCYAIENTNYHHIPVIVLFPSMYAGYQTYSNRDNNISYLDKAVYKNIHSSERPSEPIQ